MNNQFLEQAKKLKNMSKISINNQQTILELKAKMAYLIDLICEAKGRDEIVQFLQLKLNKLNTELLLLIS